MIKFVDTLESCVSLTPASSKSSVNTVSVGVHKLAPTCTENESQTVAGEDESIQTELWTTIDQEESNDEARQNWHTLNDFLIKSEPIILRALADNRRTIDLFRIYDASAAVHQDESGVICEHVLRAEDMLKDGGQAMSIAWNASGTTVGVAYGRTTHPDWCVHKCCVATWNVDRSRMNPSKPDHVFETSSCCTCLAFHPSLPNLFAVSTYAGSVAVWSLNDEGDQTASGQTPDQSPITCVSWASTDSNSVILASGAADGRILVWSLPSKGRQLVVLASFQVNISNLPRSLRKLVSGEDKGTGINSLAFADGALGADGFIAGTETGGVFQCRNDKRRWTTLPHANGDNVDPKIFTDPVVLTLAPHRGPVNRVALQQRSRAVYCSCGGDGLIRLGSAFQTSSSLELDLGMGCIYDFAWSAIRPCVLACAASSGRLAVIDLRQSTDRVFLTVDASGDKSRPVPLLSVAFNGRRGQIVATGDAEGIVKVWNLGDGFAVAHSEESRSLDELIAGVESTMGDGQNP